MIFGGFLRLVSWKAVGRWVWRWDLGRETDGIEGKKDLKGFEEEGLAFLVNYLDFYY